MARHRYRGTVVQSGIGFGSALAMILSYGQSSSVLLAIIHGIMSWLYVVYFVIVYRIL